MTHAITLERLTKTYGTRRGIVDVEVAVAAGEVFGFLGPNGAGKTTTIRVVLGFLRPTAGRALVFGHDAWREAPTAHRQLAYLSSEPGYLGEMSAADLLDHGCHLRGLRPGSWQHLAERLALDPSLQVRKLSHGNRQKVGICSVFMGREPLLIMDEPTSGLDPLMQREFLALAAEAKADGRTLFISSHNLPEVERSCDRVGIIREGRLVDVTTVGRLLGEHWRSVNLVVAQVVDPAHFALPNVRVLSSSGRDLHLMVRGDVNPLLQRIAALDVHDISITTPDLEDVFLRFYGGDARSGMAAAADADPGVGQ